MAAVLKYGENASIELSPSDDALLGAFLAPHGTPLADPTAAVVAGLAEPVNYPSVSLAVLESDRVILVVDDALSQAAAVIAGAVHALVAGDVPPAQIAVIQTLARSELGGDGLASQLSEHVAGAISWLVHDPTDQQSLSYIATSKANEAIYVNRAISDADVILPLCAVRSPFDPENHGVYSSLFPAFSDIETLKRFHSLRVLESEAEQANRQAEVDEVGWILGPRLVVLVVAGAGDEALHVFAGDIDTVGSLARESYDAAWTVSVPEPAQLVIAAISGGRWQQTWQNVARAVAAASRVLGENGVIAICSELAARPGESLSRLSQVDDYDRVLRKIRKDRAADSCAAAQLAIALAQGTVVLLSNVKQGIVEQLGLAPASSASDIARLAARSGSCILLGNAQFIVPTAFGE